MVAVSIPEGVTAVFHWHNPSGCTMALRYQGSSLRGKGGRCVRLTTVPRSCDDCLQIMRASNSWNPNSLVQASNGRAYQCSCGYYGYTGYEWYQWLAKLPCTDSLCRHTNATCFRHVSKDAERTYHIRHFCPSVRMLSARLQLDGFSWNLMLETFTKIPQETTKRFKLRQSQRALYLHL
jgi:hypothetical protein